MVAPLIAGAAATELAVGTTAAAATTATVAGAGASAAGSAAGAAAAASIGASLRAILTRIIGFIFRNPSTCLAAYLTTREVVRSGMKGSVSDAQMSDLIDRYDSISQKWRFQNVSAMGEVGDVRRVLPEVVGMSLIDMLRIRDSMDHLLNNAMQRMHTKDSLLLRQLRENVQAIVGMVMMIAAEKLALLMGNYDKFTARLADLNGLEVNDFESKIRGVVLGLLISISQDIDIKDIEASAIRAVIALERLVEDTPVNILEIYPHIKLNPALGEPAQSKGYWTPVLRIPSKMIRSLKAFSKFNWKMLQIHIRDAMAHWMVELRENMYCDSTNEMVDLLVSHVRAELAKENIKPVLNVRNVAILNDLFGISVLERDTVPAGAVTPHRDLVMPVIPAWSEKLDMFLDVSIAYETAKSKISDLVHPRDKKGRIIKNYPRDDDED